MKTGIKRNSGIEGLRNLDPQITQINADYEKQLKEKDGLMAAKRHISRKIKEIKESKEEITAQKAEFKIPVFIYSPLGLEITKIYSGLSEYWDKEAKELKAKGDHPIDFEGLYAVERFRDHKRLLEMDGPVIVIAGSGMCEEIE